MAKNESPEVDGADAGDAPLLDLNDASIKKMIARAKKRGIVTYDELNEALPRTSFPSRSRHHVGAQRMGVQLVENEEKDEDEEEEKRPRPRTRSIPSTTAPAPTAATKGADRPHRRPVRMYCARWARSNALPRGRDRHRQAHRAAATS